jgi:hypothetical protein
MPVSNENHTLQLHLNEKTEDSLGKNKSKEVKSIFWHLSSEGSQRVSAVRGVAVALAARRGHGSGCLGEGHFEFDCVDLGHLGPIWAIRGLIRCVALEHHPWSILFFLEMEHTKLKILDKNIFYIIV